MRRKTRRKSRRRKKTRRKARKGGSWSTKIKKLERKIDALEQRVNRLEGADVPSHTPDRRTQSRMYYTDDGLENTRNTRGGATGARGTTRLYWETTILE